MLKNKLDHQKARIAMLETAKPLTNEDFERIFIHSKADIFLREELDMIKPRISEMRSSYVIFTCGSMEEARGLKTRLSHHFDKDFKRNNRKVLGVEDDEKAIVLSRDQYVSIKLIKIQEKG